MSKNSRPWCPIVPKLNSRAVLLVNPHIVSTFMNFAVVDFGSNILEDAQKLMLFYALRTFHALRTLRNARDCTAFCALEHAQPQTFEISNINVLRLTKFLQFVKNCFFLAELFTINLPPMAHFTAKTKPKQWPKT